MAETRRVLEPLSSLALVAASTAIQAGKLNRYNANAVALAPPLPALSSLAHGSRLQVQKYDTSANTVTITTSAGDLIADSVTSLVLARRLETIELVVMNDTWQIAGHYLPVRSGQVVTADSTDTLTGKTIDGATNTFSNIPVLALGTGRVIGQTAAGNANTTIWRGTMAEYNAIPAKSATTLYFATA